jgi:hypothetical protein
MEMMTEDITETKGLKYNGKVVPYKRVNIMYQEDWDNFSPHPRFYEVCYCKEKDPKNIYVFFDKSQKALMPTIYPVKKVFELGSQEKPIDNDALKFDAGDVKNILNNLLSDVYNEFLNYEQNLDVLGEESFLEETDNPFYSPVDNWDWRHKFINKHIDPKYFSI